MVQAKNSNDVKASWPESLWVIGCGNMAKALLTGWLEQGYNPKYLHIFDPHFADTPLGTSLTKEHGICVSPRLTNDNFPQDVNAPEMVLLGIKPQGLMDLLTLSGWQQKGRFDNTAFLTIAVGKPARFYQNLLGDNKAIIRAMPNTPTAIGQGITALYANDKCTPRQRELSERLVKPGGAVMWLDQEAQIDDVAALSGSGPAYGFAMIEAMIEAGKNLGIPADMAEKLVLHSFAGAGQLALKAGLSATQLRQQVTSKAGITEAAMTQLLDEKTGLIPLMTRTIKAAQTRAHQLSKDG